MVFLTIFFKKVIVVQSNALSSKFQLSKCYETNNILFNQLYCPFINAYFRYLKNSIILFVDINGHGEIMVNGLNKFNKPT